jgi:hypothetical protein
LDAGVQVTKQLPEDRVQVVGIPGGRVPLNVTLPPGRVPKNDGTFLTVAVHFSETPTVAVDGAQDTVVVVATWVTMKIRPLLSGTWVG